MVAPPAIEASPSSKRRNSTTSNGHKLDVAALRHQPPVILNKQEAALVSAVSLRFITNEITKRRLRSVRVGDRRLIRREDLYAWLGRVTA